MSEQSNGGWPDPARLGVPMRPERDGWHWVVAADPNVSTETAPWWWSSGNQHWLPPVDVSGAAPLNPSRVQWRYLGPCLLPAEVAAQVAAAERRGIERAKAAAAECLHPSAERSAHMAVDDAVAAIEALLTEARDAR